MTAEEWLAAWRQVGNDWPLFGVGGGWNVRPVVATRPAADAVTFGGARLSSDELNKAIPSPFGDLS